MAVSGTRISNVSGITWAPMDNPYNSRKKGVVSVANLSYAGPFVPSSGFFSLVQVTRGGKGSVSLCKSNWVTINTQCMCNSTFFPLGHCSTIRGCLKLHQHKNPTMWYCLPSYLSGFGGCATVGNSNEGEKDRRHLSR